ncbi:unnamed protein product [Paramecium pentaurelia]|uniref:Transmembrane protein n=1 Tax=Paramecium pentaurelia TaxID=43138 RepID=A0A8S1XPE6_9CILI|nr:unnamed protein product [Paramecium pentaurelia]
MNSVLILWTYMITLAHSCSYLYNNTIFLTGTLQEVINVPLSSIFHYDNYERLTLEQNNKFLTIAAPLQKYSETIFGNLKNAKTILINSKKIQKVVIQLIIQQFQQSKMEFTIQDQMMEFIKSCLIFNSYRLYKQKTNRSVKIQQCNEEKQNNYLLVMDSNKTIYLDVQNSTSQFIKLDQIDNYMYRATQKEIQIYIEEENNLKFINSLDQETLIQLIYQDPIIIKDFQVHTNGQLSIMIDTNRIVIIEFQNNQWKLVKQILFPLSFNIQGYDYNIYTQTYAAISKNQIIYKNQTMQQEQIAEIQNQDSQYKIYLNKNYILLFENMYVKLLNEKLTSIYNLLLDQDQYFIMTNQNAQGFLIITDTKISAYAINNCYFLQLSIDSPIKDEYQKATLIQEAYTGHCQITIFYKTEDFQCQKILQSQYSEGFIVGGINTDSNEIKINPIFQGPNIQYLIEPNSLIEIQIQKYRLSYYQGISDSQTGGFHKFIQRYQESSFYLIQKDIDNQIKYYSCEGYLEITCQFLFEEGNSKQFQNISLWWSNNEDYIFSAIFQNNTVTVYYRCFSQPEEKTLTTIILESNVKQLIQIGQRLVILTELNIQIYEISISEKAKLIITFDQVVEKIYMVENQPFYLFFEKDKNLYLYDIEYNFQTLVWYTTTQSQYQESNLAIFQNHFVRIFKSIDEDEYIVTVFNYENKRNIYLEKQISIINYSDINLSDLLYSFKNNLFYIKAYSKQSSSYFVLVYKVTSNSLDTLFTKIKIKPNDRFSIYEDFLYVGPKYYIITGDLCYKAKLQEDYTQISYTEQIQLDFEVTNDLQDKLAQSIFVNSINRGEILIQLSNKINLKYHERNQTMICVDFGYDWYTGQTFDIDVSRNLQNIEYKSSLKREKNNLEYSQQTQELNQNLLIQLISNKVRIINKEDFVLQEYNFDKYYQITSILLIDGESIYVQVKQRDNIYLMIIQYSKDSYLYNCILLQYQLQFQSNIKKVFLHQNNFFIYVGNQVQIYDTNGNSINLNQFQLIQILPQYEQIKQMEFTHLKENVYQFISVDNWGNPEFQMIKINGTSTKYSNVDFQISKLISEQKINLQEIQLSAGFVLRKNEITIIFKNSASYSFNYEMECSLYELCLLAKFEFSGLYQQYQGFQLCNFYSYQNILLLTYYNKDFYRLFIYDMQIKSNNSKPNNAINSVWLSSIEEIQAFSFVYSFNGKLQLLTPEYNQSGILLHYSLLRSHQLCINSTYYEDNITFYLFNVGPMVARSTYMQERVTIEGDIPPPPPPPPPPPTPPNPPEDQESFPIWLIIVIILGGLLIGAGLYMYCRQKGKKEQDNNLLLVN